MKFKQRIINAVSEFLPNNAIFAQYYKRSASKADWKRQATVLEAKEIKDWKNGIMTATDPENPRRGDLMRFYQSLYLDNHLASVIDTRILRVQRSSFKLLDENDNENHELKELLERPWFDELVRLVMLSRFQGTTLIELFDIDRETMEIDRVDEIPQSNFIAKKGVIIKEEYDDTGVNYREGVFRDYYLQIGGDWDLGMLNQLAMIVLAKKLGIGSWMSYVDKFGVPPIFAITNRMDAKRRNELFEMLENFKQNHFAVLQGDEKIEVPRITENNQHNVFLALVDDVCNREISKRVLGGTALTDQKSFVGAAEVQERVAQDRHEADKLLFKYIFNTKIRQRLAKISPIYKDFEKYTFEWDNQETLEINEYIDAVQKLSRDYEFDIDDIRARTGLPITGIKSAISYLPTEPDDDPSKKKVSAVAQNLPSAQAKSPLVGDLGGAPMAATWDTAVEQLVEQIWSGNAKASDLNRDLVLKYYSGLNKATQRGWGAGYYTNDLTRQFRENLLKFSGAKSYSLIRQVEELKAGQTTKEAYLEQAKKLVNLHNETWQAVEEKYAANSASSARDFQAYQQDADLYPNLKYRTMGDENVRAEHAANEGVVKPINEWTKIPPLDYGCRCWLEQTFESPSDRDISVFNDTIANNPAINGELFTRNNGYFQRVTRADKQAVFGNTELMKKYMPYNRQIQVGDNTVFVSDFADLTDLEDNIKAAKLIARELKKDVYIRYHLAPGYVKGEKNPELGIETPNKLYDLKTYRPVVDGKNVPVENFVKNSLKTLQGQKANGVLNFDNYSGSADDLKVAISQSLKDNIGDKRRVQNVIVVYDDNLYKISRKQVLANDFSNFMK